MTGPNHQRRNNTTLFHFITIVICARQTVCLLNETLAVEPTNSEHLSPDNITYITCGKDTPECLLMCAYCNEDFPDAKMDCLFPLMDHYCVNTFITAMNHTHTDWCDWDHVRGLYINLSNCTEEISDCLPIPWPNPVVERLFLELHLQYFQDCPSEELTDAPPLVVFALVITPICLIPVMVSLVVLKTKNGDGGQ